MTTNEARPRGAQNGAWKAAHAGDRFGRYVLVELLEMTPRGQRWLCRCDCGTETPQCLAALRSVLKQRMPQCQRCGRAQRSANGGARRAGLASLAANRGDRYAFASLQGPIGPDDLPDW